MACHIIQTAPGQVGGEKRVRSWGAAANRGAAWRIRSIFHDSSVVDRAMSCPGAIQIKAIRIADKASFLAPAIEFLITSYLERSLDDTYVASLLYAMIHDLYGCARRQLIRLVGAAAASGMLGTSMSSVAIAACLPLFRRGNRSRPICDLIFIRPRREAPIGGTGLVTSRPDLERGSRSRHSPQRGNTSSTLRVRSSTRAICSSTTI